MKVIIAGSRNIENYDLIKTAIIISGYEITEVICGGARGVDLLGEKYAKENLLDIVYFYPDYKKYNYHYAPLVRNSQMAEYGEALIAIWDGKSKGTKNMIDQMKRFKKSIFIYNIITQETTQC